MENRQFLLFIISVACINTVALLEMVSPLWCLLIFRR